MFPVLFIAVFSVLALSLSACIPDAESVTPPSELSRPVKMITVGPQNPQHERIFSATVEAVNEVELAFRVSGQLIKRPVRAGLAVNKGDLIAQLDPKDFKNQVADRQARFNLAKAQYQRAAKVIKQGHISQSEFDAKKAEMLAAKTALKQAKDNLSYTIIYAPFSGEVSKVFMSEHEFVDVKQAVVMMQSTDNVYIALQVPERIVAMIEDTDEAEKAKTKIIFDSHPEQSFIADFHEINTQADLATRTYKVRLMLPTPEHFTVLPGMSAKAIVDLSQLSKTIKNVLSIPAACVFQAEEDAKQYVWIYKADLQQVEKRAVTVGEITDAGIEILEGLKTGEQVVVAGVHQINEKTKVRPLMNERGL